MGETVRVVGSNLGSLLTVFALLMATPAAVAVLFGEWYAVPGVLAAAAVTGGTGLLLARTFHPDEESAVHGVITAAIGWLLAGVYGALPLLFVASTVAADPGWLATPEPTSTLEALRSPTNALFEGTSGVTGTGLTMAETEGDLPRTLLWWRSLMQWVGGIGVVVLAAAVVLTSESEAFESLYEQQGAVTSLRDDTRETIAVIWWIFLLLTFVAVVAFWLAGMPPWHAVNHAMTGVSTGGFAVVDEGIAAYDSPVVEAVVVPFMLLGAISFAVHHQFLQGEVALLWRDAQSRWLFALCGAGGVGVAALLLATDSTLGALRAGGFQFVSALTCTGFQTDPELGERWPVAAHLLVVPAMVVGGAAGSTAGGIKLVRAISLAKGTLYSATDFLRDEGWEVDVAQEDAEATAGKSAAEFQRAAAVGLLWLLTLFVVLVVLVVVLPTGEGGHALEDVVFEVASAQGNVGLSADVAGPELPTTAKLALVAAMWIGRLEIVPVVVTARVLLEGLR